MLGFHCAQIKRLDRVFLFFRGQIYIVQVACEVDGEKHGKDQIQKKMFDGCTVYTRY